MCYTPRKHLGRLYFPIVSSGHFSVPVIFAQTRTVTRSLGLFVPVHTSPLNACVLSGNNRQYRACLIFIIPTQERLKYSLLPVFTHVFIDGSIFTAYTPVCDIVPNFPPTQPSARTRPIWLAKFFAKLFSFYLQNLTADRNRLLPCGCKPLE